MEVKYCKFRILFGFSFSLVVILKFLLCCCGHLIPLVSFQSAATQDKWVSKLKSSTCLGGQFRILIVGANCWTYVFAILSSLDAWQQAAVESLQMI